VQCQVRASGSDAGEKFITPTPWDWERGRQLWRVLPSILSPHYSIMEENKVTIEQFLMTVVYILVALLSANIALHMAKYKERLAKALKWEVLSILWMAIWFGTGAILAGWWGGVVLSPLGRMAGWLPLLASLFYIHFMLIGQVSLKRDK
jgi:hypothetical protein